MGIASAGPQPPKDTQDKREGILGLCSPFLVTPSTEFMALDLRATHSWMTEDSQSTNV